MAIMVDPIGTQDIASPESHEDQRVIRSSREQERHSMHPDHNAALRASSPHCSLFSMWQAYTKGSGLHVVTTGLITKRHIACSFD